MVEGESGILAISPPWFRPEYEPSKRRLTWPNGARATTFSAEEPERLRGPQHDGAWSTSWPRAGTPRRGQPAVRPPPGRGPAALRDHDAQAGAAGHGPDRRPDHGVTRGTTYDNRANLAPSFFDRIVTKYEGTRLGRQELMAEVLEVGDGVWFAAFDPAKHVTRGGRVRPAVPGAPGDRLRRLAARGAVWFQVSGPTPKQRRVAVFGDFHAVGMYSEAAAKAILARGRELPCRGEWATVRLDPARRRPERDRPDGLRRVRAGIRPAGTGRWPRHRVADGLDQLEVLLDHGFLLIHPRCTRLKAAFQNYARKRTGRGDWLDEPADPQHPHEDLMDALRGGVRDRFPEGRIEQPEMRWVSGSRII